MIHYVVVAEDGNVLRFGTCSADELALHGPHVLAFDEDPGVTDVSHRYDHQSRAFVALEPEPA